MSKSSGDDGKVAIVRVRISDKAMSKEIVEHLMNEAVIGHDEHCLDAFCDLVSEIQVVGFEEVTRPASVTLTEQAKESYDEIVRRRIAPPIMEKKDFHQCLGCGFPQSCLLDRMCSRNRNLDLPGWVG
jgi:hypothetical protein